MRVSFWQQSFNSLRFSQLLKLNFTKQFVAVCEAAIAHAAGRPTVDVRCAATSAVLAVDTMLVDCDNDGGDDDADIKIERSDFDDDIDDDDDNNNNNDTAAAAAAELDDDEDEDDESDPATVDRRRHAALRRFAEFVHDRLVAKK
jgi:hypothetical protein